MLAPVMVLAAIAMVLVRKAVHSALLLATVMICLAVQYAAQDAPFLFAVQIIVYTGAILMLFLFVLMLVGVDASDSLVETIRGQRLLAGLAFLGFGDPAGRRRRQRGVRQPGRAGRRAAGRQPEGDRAAAVRQVRVRLRGDLGAADHRGAGRDDAGAPRAADQEADPARPRRGADPQVRRAGVHPGPLPTPGVLARHNAVDTPALLPDGSIAPTSVSRVLQARGTVFPETEERDEIDEVRKIAEGDAGSTQVHASRASERAQRPFRMRAKEDERDHRAVHRARGDPVQHRRARRAGAPQRHRRLHVCRADAERNATSRSSASPASTATSTARSPPSS